MNKNLGSQSGFSLVELMIAMSLSLLLILGIATVFSSLKNTSSYSQQLENTQEVLRFTNSIFSRAVHRADEMDNNSYTGSDGGTYQQLDLTFNLDNLDTSESYSSCLGNPMASQYYESYRLTDNELLCAEYTTAGLDDSSKTFTAIGTNIDSLNFSITDDLLTVTITPTDETDSIQMMFAQRQVILGLN
ncbi:prepilin-type N-terminal cleavage/methylation domain-containing protein [Psychromonas sp. SP041]|uniref:PilW family protein n=1 Tax=Psychromonas sp. SP041 TaxID=1365007 RepID=UPI00041AC8C9|nr:prepilin-type N-terminal cleavage/methylation domain-containing protein [Psychromonas sp. SP041]